MNLFDVELNIFRLLIFMGQKRGGDSMLDFSFKKILGFLNSAIIPQHLSCPNPVSNHHHPTILQMRESNDIPVKWLINKHCNHVVWVGEINEERV